MLLWPLMALAVLLLCVREFQTRSWRSQFCQPFLSVRTVRVYEQQPSFPGKPQPQPRAVTAFPGAQFSSFASVVELKPRAVSDGCAGHSNALVFEAVNEQNQVVADFRLEKQLECGSWVSRPRSSTQWNQKFKNFRLTPASHAALFQLMEQKFKWKNR